MIGNVLWTSTYDFPYTIQWKENTTEIKSTIDKKIISHGNPVHKNHTDER